MLALATERKDHVSTRPEDLACDGGSSIDAVGEAIRRHGREGAIARYLLTMEKYLLPDGDRRRVERPGGYFRKLTDIPDRGIDASLRAMENARVV